MDDIQKIDQAVMKAFQPFGKEPLLYFVRGDWEGAKAYFIQNTNLQSSQTRDALRQLGQAINNFAFIRNRTGEIAKAENAYYYALMIHCELLSKFHPDAAVALYNAGYFLLDRKKDAKGAFQYLAQSLETWKIIIREQDEPGYIHYLASCLHTLGEVFVEEKQYDYALRNFGQALELRETILPKNHPELAASLTDLGIMHTLLGDMKSARGYLKRAYELDREIYGPNHPTTLQVSDTLKHVEQNRRPEWIKNMLK